MDSVQITLNAENKNVIDVLKSLLLQMRGVSDVRFSSDDDFDITSTPAYQEAMEDIAHGRIYRAANAKEMFAKARTAIEEMRDQSEGNGNSGMTLDEINTEIRATHHARKH
ncbi:MAG: hypothetical protein IJ745_00525 [Bacteroidales bacterium]|nr:hypothetical protein [Bacteroidales bacterium]